MKNPSDRERADADLRTKILGLGERSIRKSYYPALRRQMDLLERYRALLNQATNAICLLSYPGLRFLDTNPSATCLFGIDSQRQAEYRLPDLLDSESSAALLQWADSDSEEDAMHLHLEARSYAAGGAGMILDLWLTLVGFGEKQYLVCVAQDISKRKEAEVRLHQALSETEAARGRIDTILRSVGDGLLVVDPDGSVSLLNPAAEEILGRSLRTSHGRPYDEIIDDPGLRRQIAAVLEGEERSLSGEWETVDRDVRRTYRAKTSPVLGPARQHSGAITILQNITREREFDRMKDEFISTAAHELRTPLTSLIGYAELLNNPVEFGNVPPEQQQEFIATIHEKSLQLSRIVDDLLDLSRIQSGKVIVLKPQRGLICPLLRKIIEAFRQAESGHSFTLELPPQPLELDFDPARVSQLLENLLGNAVKFSPAGGEITVSARRDRDFCRISIEDQGIGIPAGELERVFDRFYRIDSSDTGFAGIGLGLAISRQIVEGHGGRIWLKSVEGRGTRVTFTLLLSG